MYATCKLTPFRPDLEALFDCFIISREAGLFEVSLPADPLPVLKELAKLGELEAYAYESGLRDLYTFTGGALVPHYDWKQPEDGLEVTIEDVVEEFFWEDMHRFKITKHKNKD